MEEEVSGIGVGAGMGGGEAGFFEAFDLGDLVVVDDDVDLAVAEAFDLVADEVEPGGAGACGGVLGDGGGHGGERLDLVKDGNLDKDILHKIDRH